MSNIKIQWCYDGSSIKLLGEKSNRIIASLEININSAVLSVTSKSKIETIAKEALEKIVPLLPFKNNY
jgi:hypothetical protein